MIAQDMADHEHALPFTGNLCKHLPVHHIHRQWLFDEDVLAGLKRLTAMEGMKSGRRRDRDSLYVLIFEQFLEPARRHVITRGELGSGGCAKIADGRKSAQL